MASSQPEFEKRSPPQKLHLLWRPRTAATSLIQASESNHSSSRSTDASGSALNRLARLPTASESLAAKHLLVELDFVFGASVLRDAHLLRARALRNPESWLEPLGSLFFGRGHAKLIARACQIHQRDQDASVSRTPE